MRSTNIIRRKGQPPMVVQAETVPGGVIVSTTVGEREYVVLKGNEVLRRTNAAGFAEAESILKPDHSKGEAIFIKCGGQP